MNVFYTAFTKAVTDLGDGFVFTSLTFRLNNSKHASLLITAATAGESFSKL